MCAFEEMMRKQIVMPAHLMNDCEHPQDRNLFKDFSAVAQDTKTYTGQVLASLPHAVPAMCLQPDACRLQLVQMHHHCSAHLNGYIGSSLPACGLFLIRHLTCLLSYQGAPVSRDGLHSELLLNMQDYVNIMGFLMKHWNIEGMTGLNSEAQQAQESVCKLLGRFQKLTDRQARMSAKKKVQDVQFSWIYNKNVTLRPT